MAICLIIGIPIAFSIAISSLVYLLVSQAVPLPVVALRMVVGIDTFTLLAIPLFLLAGALMAEGEITSKIMRFASALVGKIPGGMAMVMVISCMLFGAISGSGVADVAAIGAIMLPAMKGQGYKPSFSAALLGCSGSLGTIIPPSIVMVILGITMETSIGKLFLGGIIPGIITGSALMMLSYFFAVKERYPRGERFSLSEVYASFKEAILPLLTPIIIVGGILEGIFTATEAGGVAAAYAFFLSVVVYRKITFRRLYEIFFSVAKTSAVVLFIISAASLFGWILADEQIPQLVAHYILSFSHNYWVIIALINLLLLILGTFMETIAIIIIVIPVLLPIVTQIGMDMTHFGVMVAINLAIGANTPPVGVDLITACKMANIPLESSTRYAAYFVGAMIAALILIIVFPQVVTFIPNYILK